MRIDNAFEVAVGVEDVWAALLDIERVAPCLPGAAIDERRAGDEYGGSMKIKLGPVTSTFQGTLKVTEADAAAHRSVIEASARDTRGQGAAAATIVSTLEPAGDGTRVAVQTDLQLAGTAAQFGRGVVADVSQTLMRTFADRLADEIRDPRPRTGDAPAPVGRASEPQGEVEAGDAMAGPGVAPGATPGAPPGARTGTTPGGGGSRPRRDEDDVLDLTAASRDAVLKRAAPAAAVAGVLALLLAVLRRPGGRRGALVHIEGPLVVVKPRRAR